MTLKDKMKTYNFWISLVSAVLLLVRIIGDKYGFAVDAGLVMDITTGVCGIFVILGIISAPQKNQESQKLTNSKNENNQTVITEEIKEEDNAMENQSQNVIGRFQNILETMKQKAQICADEVENVTQNIENRVEIIEDAASDVVTQIAANDEDVLVNVEDVIEIEDVDIEKTDDVVIEDESLVLNCDVEDNQEQMTVDTNAQNQTTADGVADLIAELSDAQKQQLIEMLQA